MGLTIILTSKRYLILRRTFRS